MTNAYPSINPANEDSMLGLMNETLRKFLQDVDDMLPARVIAYDRATNRAQVQPLIQVVKTNGEVVPRAQIASVPVFQIGAGGFMLNFPVNPGDLGFIKANDRDISLYLQSFTDSSPNTFDYHKFSFGVFFPAAMRGFTIAEEDAANVVLQTLDGSVRVALWSNKVKVTAPTVEVKAATSVTVESPITTFKGNVVIEGSLNSGTVGGGGAVITGNIDLQGSMVATGEVTADGIPLSTHRHTGVQSGGSNTGGPTP